MLRVAFATESALNVQCVPEMLEGRECAELTKKSKSL